MDLKNFDKHIKSSLENIEEPFDSASWHALENRLNAAFSEEQPAAVEPVDLVVKRTLERMEVPFQKSDWNLLQAKLNLNALVRRIRLTKLAELAIFLLLLLNIEGFLGGFKEVVRPKPALPEKSAQPMAASKSKKGSKLHPSGASSSKLGSMVEKVAALIVTPFQTTVASQTLANTPLPAIFPQQSVLDGKLFYANSGMVAFQNVAPIPQSKAPDFAWKTFFEVIPGVANPPQLPSSAFYAASFVSIDNNQFKGQTPPQANHGYGGGLVIGTRAGKWGVETGLAYSHKNFVPKRQVEYFAGNPVDGQLGAYVKTVDAEIFSVPIKVTRRIAALGKTSAHAVAGLTGHVATEKRFTYKLVKTAPTSPVPTPGPNASQYVVPMTNNDGYFEGGNLKTNAYATADIGLRVQHPFGKRYVAFVEPSYRQSIGGGFGPNKERVNTFSFQAGVMAAL